MYILSTSTSRLQDIKNAVCHSLLSSYNQQNFQMHDQMIPDHPGGFQI